MTEEATSRKNNQRLMVQPAGTLMSLAWPAAATGFPRCTIQVNHYCVNKWHNSRNKILAKKTNPARPAAKACAHITTDSSTIQQVNSQG
jgi:hypothetical protein